MRFYTQTTQDEKLELRTYPTDQEIEVGATMRLTKIEARNLRDLIDQWLKEQDKKANG